MDKVLKEKLNEALTQLIEGLQKGSEFAVDQAPLVVQELIAWKRVELSAVVGVSLLAFVIGLVAVYVFSRRGRREFLAKKSGEGNAWENPYDEDRYFFGALFSGIAAVIGFVACMKNVPDLLQVCIAPRVYVVEYVTGLLK